MLELLDSPEERALAGCAAEHHLAREEALSSGKCLNVCFAPAVWVMPPLSKPSKAERPLVFCDCNTPGTPMRGVVFR